MVTGLKRISIGTAILTAAISTNAQAGVAVSANAVAEVLPAAGAGQALHMDFGTIAQPDRAFSGTVIIDPADGARSCSSTLVCNGTHALAKLQLSGAGSSVQVNFASSFELIGTGRPIAAEVLFAGGPGTVVQHGGSPKQIQFGAKLQVGAYQTPGTYVGLFDVSLEYS